MHAVVVVDDVFFMHILVEVRVVLLNVVFA